MRIEEAHRTLRSAHPYFARFYGSDAGLDWGVGLIARGLAYPVFDRREGEFSVVTGWAYVVSHECDIDPANDRPFNEAVLICPIIPLETVLSRYLSAKSPEKIRSFLIALGRREVDRAVYIPTIADNLPYGGVLYLNALTHTDVKELSLVGVERCCAVSAFGLRYLDAALHNALLKRPKAQRLPLSDLISEDSQTDTSDLKEAFRVMLREIWKVALRLKI